MKNEYVNTQIIRKDAKGCFVESLWDCFGIGRMHLVFAAYDASRAPGERQTALVHVYIPAEEFIDICRMIESGELRHRLFEAKKEEKGDALIKCLGGTCAEKLAAMGKARPDGMSLSRVMQLVPARRSDFLLVADSGPGSKDEKGLIVPRFGDRPENHVSVMLSHSALAQLFLVTRMHYQAWLGAWYARNGDVWQTPARTATAAGRQKSEEKKGPETSRAAASQPDYFEF